MDVATGPFISLGITCDRTDPLADGLCLIFTTKALVLSSTATQPLMLL